MLLNRVDDEISNKKQKTIDIDKLKWAYTNDCLNSERIWLKAINERNIEILEWAKTERLPWVESLFDEVCKTDNVKVADWLYKNNFKYSDTFYTSLAENGAFNILCWVILNIDNINTKSNNYCYTSKSYPDQKYIIVRNIAILAAKHGHKNIVQYIVERYDIKECDQKRIFDNAILSNNTKLIMYLFETKCMFDKETIMTNASRLKDFDLIKYIFNKNSCYWRSVYLNDLQNIITNFRKKPYHCLIGNRIEIVISALIDIEKFDIKI